jgi:hypothetical protein
MAISTSANLAAQNAITTTYAAASESPITYPVPAQKNPSRRRESSVDFAMSPQIRQVCEKQEPKWQSKSSTWEVRDVVNVISRLRRMG